ncbi:MAG: HAMP domain-containing protein [Alphaproteobacteria bacterium]|nr:HAMP domain-containing protein [Alphaproteobacteria bacterium]
MTTQLDASERPIGAESRKLSKRASARPPLWKFPPSKKAGAPAKKSGVRPALKGLDKKDAPGAKPAAGGARGSALRLLRTSSFRFAMAYVVVFAIAVGVLGVYIYNATFGVASRQTDALINQEIEVLADVFAKDGAATLRRVVRDRAAWRDGGIYMLIAAPSGAVLAGNLSALPVESLSADDDFFNFSFERQRADPSGGADNIETRLGRGKIKRFRASPDAQTFFLVFVGRDVTDRERLLERTQRLIFRLALATVAVGLVIGLGFSRSLLRQVDAVNRTARAIRGGDLSKRIALTGAGDELEDLAVNLNSMLDQIERLMTGMREVSDNIAHDLRSPLTRIKARLSAAMKGDDREKEEALRLTLDETESMIATFNALLSIARIESGEGAGAMEAVDLVAIAQEMTELYEPAAQEAGFELVLDAAPSPPVKGSRALISQAIANLFDNALKYAVGGSKIEIRVRPSATAKNAVELEVADNGPGVPAEDREHVLQRFVRLETSRTTSGSGLGLSLVAAIARAHRASLTLDDAHPGADAAARGLLVTIRFPAL